MVTADQVKRAMAHSNITHVNHHACGICNSMTAYVIHKDKLYYDSSCNCTYDGRPEQRSFQDAADWINMQDNPDVIADLYKKFGLDKNVPEELTLNECIDELENLREVELDGSRAMGALNRAIELLQKQELLEAKALCWDTLVANGFTTDPYGEPDLFQEFIAAKEAFQALENK